MRSLLEFSATPAVYTIYGVDLNNESDRKRLFKQVVEKYGPIVSDEISCLEDEPHHNQLLDMTDMLGLTYFECLEEKVYIGVELKRYNAHQITEMFSRGKSINDLPQIQPTLDKANKVKNVLAEFGLTPKIIHAPMEYY